MKKLFTNSHWFASGVLLLVVFALMIINYHPGSTLSGWDNLHPEFNCALNMKRAFFSGWQEYQGLGLPAGHGHATELPREIILCSLGVIFPQADLRYIYFSISLYVGALGIYFLSFFLFRKRLGSFLGSLFYLLHIATVELLFAPYEAFMVYYALLPWMIVSLLFYLHSPTKKRLIFLFLINILGSSQFYIPTLFIVYAIVIGVIFIHHLVKTHAIKPIIQSVVTIGVANLYWLGLFAYYTFTNINSQKGAHVNFLYSEDVFLKNLEFGNLHNLILFKGFMFKYTGLINDGYGYIFKNWIDHFGQWYIVAIGYIFFLLVIVGCIQGLLNNKNRHISVLFLIFFTFLALNTAPLSFINNVLHSNPLFHQIFRNPFTKFGNALLLFEAVLFVQGCNSLLSVIASFIPPKHILIKKTAFISFFLVLFLIYSYPSWRGNFLYSQLYISYPDDYKELFSYFRQQPPGRIANFPQYAIDGWSTNSWGYYGSGFLWYGIEQPILDRAFDVWNLKNEQYYWEISHAVYSRNISLLENIFDKYDVSWVLIDKSIIGSYSPHALYLDELADLLSQSPRISLKSTFGKLILYQVKPPLDSTSFIRFPSSLTRDESKTSWYWEDKTYELNGSYTTDSSLTTSGSQSIFPYQGLFTNRNIDERDFSIKEIGNYFSVTGKSASNFEGILHIPKNDQPLINVDSSTLLTHNAIDPIIIVNSEQIATDTARFELDSPLSKLDTITVLIPKTEGLYSYKLGDDFSFIESQVKNCNSFNKGYISKNTVDYPSESAIQLISIHANNCLEVPLPQLPQSNAYILSIKSKHIQGKPLLIRLTNNSSRRIELETYLSDALDEHTSYFILPQREPSGLGYSILFDNISLLQNQKTVNDLIDIQLFQFPYRFLSNIHYESKNPSMNQKQIKNTTLGDMYVTHSNPSSYLIQFNTSSVPTTIELTQTFNSGWYAYPIMINQKNTLLNTLISNLPFLFASPLKHIELNDWSNGWILSDISTNAISIVYLPQILEYLGIGIAFCYGAWLMFFYQRRR